MWAWWAPPGGPEHGHGGQVGHHGAQVHFWYQGVVSGLSAGGWWLGMVVGGFGLGIPQGWKLPQGWSLHAGWIVSWWHLVGRICAISLVVLISSSPLLSNSTLHPTTLHNHLLPQGWFQGQLLLFLQSSLLSSMFL